MKRIIFLFALLSVFAGFSQNLVENCSPIEGNIQMSWYPMSQYTNPESPGFVYTEGETSGSPNIGLVGFQIPMTINYSSTVTISDDFEISQNQEDDFRQTIVQNLGSTRTYIVRLKYGLPAGDYTGSFTTTTSYYPNNICTYTFYGRVLPATASVDDFNLSKFKIYPNPVNETLSFTENTDVEVFSVQGVKVGSYKNETNIDVSQLASGMYLLRTPKFGQHKFIKK